MKNKTFILVFYSGVNGVAVNLPNRNGTWIYFNDATLNTVVLQYGCGWDPNVIYSADTIIIYAPYPWVPGDTYYVTFDSGFNFWFWIFLFILYLLGVSSGSDFCRK